MGVEITKVNKKRCPSTQRTMSLKEAYMGYKPSICAERSVLVTESFKNTEALPPVLRQAIAFDRVLSEMPIWIQDGELIVSNIASRPRGVFLFPEYDNSWLQKELDTISTRSGDPWLLSDEDKDRLKDCLEYWRGKSLGAVADALTTEEVRQAEKNSFIDIRMAKQGGIGHIVPDIEGVITRGLNAFVKEAESHLSRLNLTDPDDYAKLPFLKAVVIADKAVIKWAGRFADLAREKAAAEQSDERKRELLQIADVCDRVPANPSRSFRDALQVVALIMASVQIESNGVSIGTGRLDQYCYPYYERDIKEGVLTKDETLELLECLWLKVAESNRAAPEILTYAHNGYPFWIQVPIGGQTADGYDATNELSYLLLDVSSNMQLHEPTVSARIHKGTSDRFLLEC
jgi:pyruvate-formate lyase